MNASIEILQLGLHWFPERGGGADRMYADLVRALPRCDVKCRGLVAGTGRVIVESGGAIRAFAPIEVPVRQRWRAMRGAVQEELNRFPPDLVASHFAFYTFPALRSIRKKHIPLVVHFQGPWANESRVEGAGRIAVRSKWLIEKTVYRRARRLIVLSKAFGNILEHDYRVPAERIRTVPPGIDTARYRMGVEDRVTRHGVRQRLDWPTDRPIVLTVRRLVQRMGLENLIDAISDVRREVPDILVLIAGKGPLTNSLQERINAKGLEQHVRLLGFVSDQDLPFAYAAADITVVPTVQLEGFGLVVVESLAAGTPVLVTPVGGLPEAVRDLSPELIMTDAGAGSIARRLTDALRSRLRLPSQLECASFAERTYDWSVIGPRIRAVYEEAIGSM